MKKLIHTLANEENFTPAGLMISFLLGVLAALLCITIFFDLVVSPLRSFVGAA